MRENFRLYFVLLLFLSFLGFFEFRLYELQILKHDYYRRKAERERLKEVEIFPSRGKIYDAKGEELAVNVPSWDLYARPFQISSPAKVTFLLSSILKEEPKKIQKKVSSTRPFIWIKRRVTTEEKRAIERLNLKGVGFKEGEKRFYPQGRLASQLLGFVGIDNQGLAGLEYKYDKILSGEKGVLLIEEDALNYRIFPTERVVRPPRPGRDLVLSIDSILQCIVEEELSLTRERTRAKSVEAIFINPHTGEILALANKPDYGPNNFLSFSSFEQKNRAIGDLYEPGSAFKPFNAAILLEEKLVQPEEEIFCEEYIKVANHTIYDWKNFNDPLTFKEVLKYSSNVGMVKFSSRISPRIFYQWLKIFKLGEITQIDLPGEARGLIIPYPKLSPVDFACMAIGQGIALTPLRMVVSFSSLINGGWLLKPYLVKVIKEEGKVVKEFSPRILGKTVSEKTSRVLREILKLVVEEGTGRGAKVEGYSIGGKTGTAQVPDPEGGGYLEGRYAASFIGFAPVEDPVISGIVVVKEPEGSYWGGEIAAPLFGRIMKRILPYLGVLPEEKKSKWARKKNASQ